MFLVNIYFAQRMNMKEQRSNKQTKNNKYKIKTKIKKEGFREKRKLNADLIEHSWQWMKNFLFIKVQIGLRNKTAAGTLKDLERSFIKCISAGCERLKTEDAPPLCHSWLHLPFRFLTCSASRFKNSLLTRKRTIPVFCLPAFFPSHCPPVQKHSKASLFAFLLLYEWRFLLSLCHQF